MCAVELVDRLPLFGLFGSPSGWQLAAGAASGVVTEFGDMGNRLYVGNLSFDTTANALEELFGGIGGGATDVHLVTDRMTGRSRGFAFVTMAILLMAGLASADTVPGAPTVTILSPLDESVIMIPSVDNLIMTFNEDIAIGTGDITIKDLDTPAQTVIAVFDTTQVSVDGAILTIDPTTDLLISTNYAIQIDAGAVVDVDEGLPHSGFDVFNALRGQPCLSRHGARRLDRNRFEVDPAGKHQLHLPLRLFRPALRASLH